MNVVEIDQKKALLVKFAKREPIGSALDSIHSNTSETVQILKSISGGFKQKPTADASPIMRSAEPAAPTIFSPQIAVPAPIVITKETATPSAAKPPKAQKKGAVSRTQIALPADKTVDKKTTEKPEKPQKTGAKPGQKPIPAAGKPEPKEDLTEERRTKGLFKGLRSIFTKSFKREDKDRKELIDTEDAKETGMLALLGPMAPALGELKALLGKRDEDEPGRISKMIGLFKKKKPDEAEEDKAKPEKKAKGKRLQDEKGRFIPKPSAQKAEASKEVPEKLDIIHDDLSEGDKDQKKRDKKLRRSMGRGGGDDGGPLSLPKKILTTAAVAAVTVGVSMIAKDIYDIYKSFTAKDKKGERKGLENIKAKDVGGVAGGVAAAIAGGKAGMMLGAFAGPFGVAIGGVLGAGVGAIFGNVLGEKIGEWGSAKPDKNYDPYARSRKVSHPAMGLRPKPKEEKGPKPSRYDYGASAAAKKFAIEDKADPWAQKAAIAKEKKVAGSWEKKVTRAREVNLGVSAAGWESKAGRTMPVDEDRSPRVARKDKELQEKIDVTNKELISKTDETNKLLKELIQVQKNTGQAPGDNQISNGITNQSDLAAIRGND